MTDSFPHLAWSIKMCDFDSVYIENHLQSFVNSLTADDMARLASELNEFRRNGDVSGLAKVYFENAADYKTREQVGRLIIVYSKLGRQDIEPFKAFMDEFSKHEVIDWSIVPSELMFLVEPAIKYGPLSDAEMVVASDSLVVDERALLYELKERARVADSQISKWLEAYPFTEYGASWKIYRMLFFLEFL